jgi:hypothetical protein
MTFANICNSKAIRKSLPKLFRLAKCSTYDDVEKKKSKTPQDLARDKLLGKHVHHKVSKAEKKARSTFPPEWTPE